MRHGHPLILSRLSRPRCDGGRVCGAPLSADAGNGDNLNGAGCLLESCGGAGRVELESGSPTRAGWTLQVQVRRAGGRCCGPKRGSTPQILVGCARGGTAAASPVTSCEGYIISLQPGSVGCAAAGRVTAALSPRLSYAGLFRQVQTPKGEHEVTDRRPAQRRGVAPLYGHGASAPEPDPGPRARHGAPSSIMLGRLQVHAANFTVTGSSAAAAVPVSSGRGCSLARNGAVQVTE